MCIRDSLDRRCHHLGKGQRAQTPVHGQQTGEQPGDRHRPRPDVKGLGGGTETDRHRNGRLDRAGATQARHRYEKVEQDRPQTWPRRQQKAAARQAGVQGFGGGGSEPGGCLLYTSRCV